WGCAGAQGFPPRGRCVGRGEATPPCRRPPPGSTRQRAEPTAPPLEEKTPDPRGAGEGPPGQGGGSPGLPLNLTQRLLPQRGQAPFRSTAPPAASSRARASWYCWSGSKMNHSSQTLQVRGKCTATPPYGAADVPRRAGIIAGGPAPGEGR